MHRFPFTAARPRPGSSREWCCSRGRFSPTSFRSTAPARYCAACPIRSGFKHLGVCWGSTGIRAASRPLFAAGEESLRETAPTGASPPEARGRMKKSPAQCRRMRAARPRPDVLVHRAHGCQSRQRGRAGRLSPLPSRLSVHRVRDWSVAAGGNGDTSTARRTTGSERHELRRRTARRLLRRSRRHTESGCGQSGDVRRQRRTGKPSA